MNEEEACGWTDFCTGPNLREYDLFKFRMSEPDTYPPVIGHARVANVVLVSFLKKTRTLVQFLLARRSGVLLRRGPNNYEFHSARMRSHDYREDLCICPERRRTDLKSLKAYGRYLESVSGFGASPVVERRPTSVH